MWTKCSVLKINNEFEQPGKDECVLVVTFERTLRTLRNFRATSWNTYSTFTIFPGDWPLQYMEYGLKSQLRWGFNAWPLAMHMLSTSMMHLQYTKRIRAVWMIHEKNNVQPIWEYICSRKLLNKIMNPKPNPNASGTKRCSRTKMAATVSSGPSGTERDLLRILLTIWLCWCIAYVIK